MQHLNPSSTIYDVFDMNGQYFDILIWLVFWWYELNILFCFAELRQTQTYFLTPSPSLTYSTIFPLFYKSQINNYAKQLTSYAYVVLCMSLYARQGDETR